MSHPSQKTIWLLLGEWPRPQLLQTAVAPGVRFFLGFLSAEAISGVVMLGVDGLCFLAGASVLRFPGWKVLACVILLPELESIGRLISSDASVSSSASSSVSPNAFLRFRFTPRLLVAARRPARLPLGLPPRLIVLPLVAPARLPLGLPPRLTDRALVDKVVAARVGTDSPDAGSIFILGRRPPLPLRPPIFAPARDTFVIEAPLKSWLVTIWLNTDSRAASHSGVVWSIVDVSIDVDANVLGGASVGCSMEISIIDSGAWEVVSSTDKLGAV